MGRNKKTGLNYFPFDIDTFQDIKIRKLIKYQGGKAVTIYASLLCLIYKSGYYMRWDKELPFIVSEMTGFEEAYISEVIKSCLVLGLFSKELFDSDRVLTSSGIQERYSAICRQLKRKCDIREFTLISSKETGISSVKIGISSEEMRINPEEIPQKKKKENIKEISLSGEKENPPEILPPGIVEMPLPRCEDELRSDQAWAETVCMNTRFSGHPDFTSGMFTDYLRSFFAKLANEGVTSKSPADAKSHFARWLAIELEKQKRNGTNRNPYPSKQEANDYALHALQERMEQRRSGIQDELPKPF